MTEIKDRRKKNWFWASDRIFDVDGLTEHDIVVYLFLCRTANSNYCSFPSRKQISIKCRISVDTVDRSLKNLEGKGLLRKCIRKKNNEYISSLYEIFDPPEPKDQEHYGFEGGVAAHSGQVAAHSGQVAAHSGLKDYIQKDYILKDNNKNRYPDSVPVEKCCTLGNSRGEIDVPDRYQGGIPEEGADAGHNSPPDLSFASTLHSREKLPVQVKPLTIDKPAKANKERVKPNLCGKNGKKVEGRPRVRAPCNDWLTGW